MAHFAIWKEIWEPLAGERKSPVRIQKGKMNGHESLHYTESTSFVHSALWREHSDICGFFSF